LNIGIIAALPQEFAALTSQKPDKGEPVDVCPQVSGIMSGVGGNNATKAAEKLLRFKPEIDGLISWGVAAGISPELDSGTVCIPQKIVGKSGNRRTLQNSLRNYIVSKVATQDFVQIKVNYTGTVDMLNSVPSKKKLFNETSAHLADMESEALYRFCINKKLDYSIIRAISDDAYHSIPEVITRHTKESGEVNITSMLLNTLFLPDQWKPLYGLAQNFLLAQKNLHKISAILFPKV